MYENPQNVVLPEQTQMDKIIAATLYLLNTGCCTTPLLIWYPERKRMFFSTCRLT